jgi:1-deoxy-D-xylulose-5-phosphate synthase
LAEQNPEKFHGIGPFDPATGELLALKKRTYSDSFSDTMLELAKTNNRLCAITAAMPSGTGLMKFQQTYPQRLFDVGIAEEHAISMAGGLAKQGMVPVVALYSTFLQRGFDQIMQDIALLQLHVVLAIDRAGIVGDDGPTHHGVFDVGFLRQVPGMKILAPASLAEQQDMLRWAIAEYNGPVAVRYPRGGEGSYHDSAWKGLDGELVTCHRTGRDVTLVTYGSMLENALKAAELLSLQGVEATVLRLLTVSDLPAQQLVKCMPEKAPVVVLEEVAAGSGIREALAWELQKCGCDIRVEGLDLGREFVPHGSLKELYHHCGLDEVSIAAFTKEVLRQ